MTWLGPSREHVIVGRKYATIDEVRIPRLNRCCSRMDQKIQNCVGRKIGIPMGSEYPESWLTSFFCRKHNFGFVCQKWYDRWKLEYRLSQSFCALHRAQSASEGRLSTDTLWSHLRGVIISLSPEGKRSCVGPARQGTNGGVAGSRLLKLRRMTWCLGSDR
jgi:hypothetical protein